MKPLAWSHSALNDYLTCPKQFFHKRVAKDCREEQGEAALWGDRVHKFFEMRINAMTGRIDEAMAVLSELTGEEVAVYAADPAKLQLAMKALSEEFKIYTRFLKPLAALPATTQLFAEREYAINRSLQPCEWFGEGVWCRGIIDVLTLDGTHANALDWKTGKRKPNSKQLKLFALLVFIHHPEVMTCDTEFVWLATNEKDEASFHRRQEAELWQEFLPELSQYQRAFKLEQWPPKPSGLCHGWCPVTGCEYWKPKRVK